MTARAFLLAAFLLAVLHNVDAPAQHLWWTIFNRFGGEGTGSHTHMLWDWKVGDTFQFFVQKTPGKQVDTTDTRYYVYDRNQKQWLHSATITNPNGGKKSLATIGGGVNSFLENFAGRDVGVPKLALYRLWLGPSVEKMKCLTRAKGDGKWGQLSQNADHWPGCF